LASVQPCDTKHITMDAPADDRLAGAISSGIASLPPYLAPANNFPQPPFMDNHSDYHGFAPHGHSNHPPGFDPSNNNALFNDILANLAEEDKAAGTAASGSGMAHGSRPHESGGYLDSNSHPQTYVSSTYQSRSRNNGEGPVPPPPAAGMLYMPVPRPTGGADGNPNDNGGAAATAGNGRTRPHRSDSLDSSGGSEYDEAKDKSVGVRGEEKHECKWENCKQ
jgi:hypothetical protein